MFSTNPTNPNPKYQAESTKIGSDSLSSSQSAFTDLEHFADWIDAQLEVLEQQYQDFETSDSLRGHFGRK